MQNEDFPDDGHMSSDSPEDDDPLAQIDLKGPLRPEEQLPTRTHRIVQSTAPPETEKKVSPFPILQLLCGDG